MNETLQTIYQLHSIRKFSDRQIPQEDMESIIDASIRAANSSFRQSYSIIVLKDPEKSQAVCGYHGSLTLVYCVDFNRMHDIATYLGEKNAHSAPIDFITGSTDTVLAAQTAVIAAKSLGIDSLITNGVHRQDFHELYKLLELPSKYCFPLIAVVFGYSAEGEAHTKERMKNGVIHYDKYQHMSPEEIKEEIQYFDSKDKKYGLTTYTQWEAMGYQHYYQWFFQKWIGPQEDRFTTVLQDAGLL